MGGESATKQEPVSERTPVFQNIAISGVIVNGATKKIIDIDGLPEMPIRELRLSDVVGSGQIGLTARYTDHLELRNIQLNPAHGPAFTIQNASNLLLDDLSTREPLKASALLQLTNAPGAIMRNCGPARTPTEQQ
jgi:hypothetical protein